MNRKVLLCCMLIAGAASPVVAHHSFSMFDETREVVLKGAVKEFQWSNPHTWIQLNVTDTGSVVEWQKTAYEIIAGDWSSDVCSSDLSNPHTCIQLNVTDTSGKVVEWSIEGGSPNLLGRQGWKRNTFKPGDQVEITVHPLRDGQPGGSFMRAVLPDGRTLGRNP